MYKPNSEADAGRMGGYDPNLGLGKQGMSQMQYQAPQQPFRPQMPQNPMMMNQRPMNASSTTPMQGQMGAIQRNIR